MKYKTLKLTKKELNAIAMAVAQAIIDLKRNENEYDDIYVKNKLKEYQNLFKYISYIQR